LQKGAPEPVQRAGTIITDHVGAERFLLTLEQLMNVNVAMFAFFGSGAIVFAAAAPAPWHAAWIPLAWLSFISAARASEEIELPG
jgi:hypothetical protein